MGPNERHIRDRMRTDADVMRELDISPSLVDVQRVSSALDEAALLDNPPAEFTHGNEESKRWYRKHGQQMRRLMIDAENDEGLR